MASTQQMFALVLISALIGGTIGMPQTPAYAGGQETEAAVQTSTSEEEMTAAAADEDAAQTNEESVFEDQTEAMVSDAETPENTDDASSGTETSKNAGEEVSEESPETDHEEILEENEDILTGTPESEEGTELLEEEAESDSRDTADEEDSAFETIDMTATTSSITAASSTQTAVSTSTAASSSAQNTTIESGTAVALANILNLVNTNFVNSNGVVLFSNLFESLFGTIDFRSYFDPLFGSFACSLQSCTDEDVAVHLDNNATIENALLLQALSGGNAIEANGGTASIDSGNAYAGANIINVANTNLVDSNYLLVTLNAFEDVNGDIVFPSLSQFFDTLRHSSSPQSVDIVSTGGIENNVALEAASGNNTALDNGESNIETGDAHTSTNAFNEINTSLVGGKSISVIFRVHGDWAGEIFGAPDDLGWITGADGSLYLFDTEPGENGSSGGQLDIEAENDALIRNNVSVVALTGENHITGADTALISTGNAYAGANIINVANANIVGRNWILAIINIFGDFNGNIAFGRPDLWVGEQVEVPSSIKDGSELIYKTTVINNGDSKASEVTVTDAYKSEYIRIQDASLPYTVENGKLVFQLGDLAPGSATEITYTAKIENAGTGTDITNVVSVEGRETDNNMDDNSDTVTVRTESGSSNRRIERLQEKEKEPVVVPIQTGIEIERVRAETILDGASRASVQSLRVRNTADAVAHSVILHDVLRDPHGNVLEDEVWDFGDILPDEEIEIGYTITFKKDAVPGRYAFFSTIEGANVAKQVDENGYIDLSAPVAITEPEPEVAGVSISIPERPSPLKPEEEQNDVLASFIPQALAAETDSTVSERDADLQAYMPYIATIIISLFVIGGAMLRRMRQSLGASEL